jgi:hypothetical protein
MTDLPGHFAAFADGFDVNAYANSVLGTDSAQELGSALNRLNGGIDDLNRQLRTEVSLPKLPFEGSTRARSRRIMVNCFLRPRPCLL